MLENQSSAGGAHADDLDLELGPDAARGAEPAKQDDKTAEVPDKYRNKSVDDLIQMHQNAERALSQKANELGEIRRLADQLISIKPEDNTRKHERKPITAEALLDNPETALSQAVEHSTVATAQAHTASRVEALERQLSYGDFVRSHPNFQQDVKDPDFMEWVQKNPVRANLAQRADKYDFQAAKGLWDMWAEHKELLGSSKKAKANETARQAGTVRAAPATAQPGTGPVYSRAKLMELRLKAEDGDAIARSKLEDPAFNARLVAAYAEGRVR